MGYEKDSLIYVGEGEEDPRAIIASLTSRLAAAEERAEGIAEARRQERAAQREFDEADEKKMTRLRNDADMWKQSHEGQVRNTFAFQADLEAMTASRDAALARVREVEEECRGVRDMLGLSSAVSSERVFEEIRDVGDALRHDNDRADAALASLRAAEEEIANAGVALSAADHDETLVEAAIRVRDRADAIDVDLAAARADAVRGFAEWLMSREHCEVHCYYEDEDQGIWEVEDITAESLAARFLARKEPSDG